MSLFEGFWTMRLVEVGPSLRERLERWLAGQHQRTVVAHPVVAQASTGLRLRRLRQGLEQDMGPEELWTALRAPAVLLPVVAQASTGLRLADVCDALGLAEMEKAAVLGVAPLGSPPLRGPEGERALAEALETCTGFNAMTPGERQARALKAAERRGHVNLALYRELCPPQWRRPLRDYAFWCDETLRLDLVELAERGLLAKNGRTKGTFYTVVEGQWYGCEKAGREVSERLCCVLVAAIHGREDVWRQHPLARPRPLRNVRTGARDKRKRSAETELYRSVPRLCQTQTYRGRDAGEQERRLLVTAIHGREDGWRQHPLAHPRPLWDVR